MHSETQPYAARYKLRWRLRFLAIIIIAIRVFVPSHREGPWAEVGIIPESFVLQPKELQARGTRLGAAHTGNSYQNGSGSESLWVKRGHPEMSRNRSEINLKEDHNRKVTSDRFKF